MSNHVAIRMFLNKKEAQDLLNNGDFEQLVHNYALFIKELEKSDDLVIPGILKYGEMTDVLIETFGVSYILNKFEYLDKSTLDGCGSLKNTVIDLSPEHGCKCEIINMEVLKQCGVKTLMINKNIYMNHNFHLLANKDIKTVNAIVGRYYVWEFIY